MCKNCHYSRFFVEVACYLRDVHVLTHSFPTRRASDRSRQRMARPLMTMSAAMAFWRAASSGTPFQLLAESPEISMTRRKPLIELLSISRWRSEEHTSELQSLMRTSSAVLCMKHQKYILKKRTTPAPSAQQ